MNKIDFPPVLCAALIRKRFSNIESAKRVLINKYSQQHSKPKICYNMSENRLDWYSILKMVVAMWVGTWSDWKGLTKTPHNLLLLNNIVLLMFPILFFCHFRVYSSQIK